MSKKTEKLEQPAAEAPKPKTDEMREVARALAEELVPSVAVAVAQATRGPVVHDPRRQPPPPNPTRCSTCGQLLVACKDEHEMLVVYPQNVRHGKFFQGLFLNGVRYLSPRPGVAIPVPKENNFRYDLAKAEEAEDNFLHGRVIQHHSGSIGHTGTGFVPANHPGFSGA